jgi:hypothetical protein
VPAQIPKNPSVNSTPTTARYCSALSRVRFIKYEHINAVIDERDKIDRVMILVFM